MKNEEQGILSIPQDKRHSTWWDMVMTWLGANANNGTWFVGGVLAACGFGVATHVLVWASVLSYVFLALVGYMGYQTGLATVTISRAAFGVRGSIVPSLVNLTLFIGWTAANTYIAALSVGTLCHDLFGWSQTNIGVVVGILVMSILHIASVSGGARSIQLIERIGMILVLFFVVWESLAVFKTVSFDQIIHWHVPVKQHMALGAAIDYVAAFNLAWVVAGADFTRFTKKATHATLAPYVGALAGLVWFAVIGLVATISVAIATGAYDPNNSDPSTIASRLGLGIVALLVIILTSMTANAVNLLGAGSALTNIFPKINLKYALWATVAVVTVVTFIPLFVGSFLATFESFLDYVSMVLGPMIAIICTDYFAIHKGKLSISQLVEAKGQYWYHNGVNWVALLVFFVGVGLYLLGKNVALLTNTVGITFPVMVVVAVLYWGAMLLVQPKK